MARLSDLKLQHRAIIAASRFRSIDWSPGSALSKPLTEARLALVTTAGLYTPHHVPFRQSIRHDDCSYREIPADAELATLAIGQTSDAFDHAGIEADRNLAFPLDRLREMVAAAEVGSFAPRHFSFMGSILAPGDLIERTGPEVSRKLHADNVDAVLLVPV